MQSSPTMIYCNNQSAIVLTKNPQFHARTKHIEIQFHFIREVVEDGQIRLEYIHTSQNTAYIFTKGLTKDKHQQCLQYLRVETFLQTTLCYLID